MAVAYRGLDKTWRVFRPQLQDATSTKYTYIGPALTTLHYFFHYADTMDD